MVAAPNTNGSVIEQPPNGAFMGPQSISGVGAYSMVMSMADAADNLPAWGTRPALRDQMLREFWPTESMFASALYSTVSRYSSFGWSLTGPPLTTAAVQRILHTSEMGAGWIPFINKVLIDLYTQDNGAFIEVVRSGDSPSSPPVGLNHLDSGRCVRTGQPQNPVIYYDLYGKGHLLKWYQVIPLNEFPSPVEGAYGMQYCALTRCLRAAQIMREISIYKREKVSGRFTKAIHLVSGMPTRMITDAVTTHQNAADSAGQLRYLLPVIIGTLDPTAHVTHAQIDMASLPDNFDEETAMHWYVVNLANAFGTDFQDFAPMPGKGIGSGTETQTAHLKSRSKGAALFMRTVEHVFNFQGVMPSTVTFAFGEQDLAEEHDKVVVKKERALWLQILVLSGAITTEVARQILADSGDIDPRYLEMMREHDATGEVQLTASLPPLPDAPIAPGEPGPDAPPSPVGAGGAPPNSNGKNGPPTVDTKRPAVTT